VTAAPSRRSKKLQFKAEAHQLLQLVIHSVYSTKDVFLRELISNASDALDKLRIESLRDKELDADTSDLHIFIDVDPVQRTLAVRDNGIGMTYDEVIELIGTLAHSGAESFLSSLEDGEQTNVETTAEGDPAPVAAESLPDLIGRFGIGFYSSFMVATSVTLVTRRAGESIGTRWFSDGQETYTIQSEPDAPQGTTVTLELKPAAAEDGLLDYTDPWAVRDIVTRYSDFISWPIRMLAEQTAELDEASLPDDDAAVPEGEGESDATDSDQSAARGVETINSMRALWSRARSEISEQEYHDFYRYLSGDWNGPLETVHVQTEGLVSYDALLFVPSSAPYDLFQPERRSGIQLYVNRVLVVPNTDALLPDYLRFVGGVVDAHDLTLNVSRELLQYDRHIEVMRRRLTRSVLAAFKDLMHNDPERYALFWSQFGRALKEGLLTDPENRDAILALCSFSSTRVGEQAADSAIAHLTGLTTLRDYVARMHPGQEAIYYAVGESRSMLESSPHMEVFHARGLEVLLLTDPIDDLWSRSVPSFENLAFESIVQAGVTLEEPPPAPPQAEDESGASDEDAAEAPPAEPEAASFKRLVGWLSGTLDDVVSEVRVSARLTSSPACLISDAYSLTPSQEKIYRANGHDISPIKRVMEINPRHPLSAGLRDALAARDAEGGESSGADDESMALRRVAELLYGVALLSEGGEFAEPARFVQTLADQLTAQYAAAAPEPS
jgi:molecular chaperone HtpG